MSGSHAHHGDGVWSFPLDAKGRLLAGLIGSCLMLTAVGIAVYWPRDEIEVPDALAPADIVRVKATVTSVEPDACFGSEPEAGIICDRVTFDVDSGPTSGEVGFFEQAQSPTSAQFEVGDGLLLGYQSDPTLEDRFRYFFVDFQRDRPLIILALLFAGAVVALGRWQGLRSLLALGLSFVVLLNFTLPALLETASPVGVALTGSAVVAFLTMYMTHGVSHLTTVALLGTFASLGLTGALAWIFVGATSLTGLSDEDALFLLAGNDQIDLQGLLLAGIIIGSLGVLDDVTITQASAVGEIHEANPRYGSRRLFRAGLRVGRDHIGSTTNTLVFAYAGAALPLLLLFTQTQLSSATVVTSEIVAIEVVRALVGGVGLVASVPITTALAVWAVRSGEEATPVEPAAPPPDDLTAEQLFWGREGG